MDNTEKKDSNKVIWSSTIPAYLNYFVLFLSFGLIAFISWDTYQDVDYLENILYMRYQFIVCLFFLAEYFYRLAISRHKIRYFILSLPFLLISIPYLNIIEFYQLHMDREILSYLCFIPIVRGIVALVMVVTFVTKNISTTVFASYVIVLLPSVYVSALIFYVAEKNLNPAIKNFWYAMWWAGMNVTTIGCYINPVTSTGMILSLLLSLLGIIMLPLFTVYFGDVISRYRKIIKS